MSEQKSITQLLAMMRLARTKHSGQKYGIHDYYDYHLLGVLTELTKLGEFKSASSGMMEDMMIVAIGHDILEDTLVTEKELLQMGFDRFIVDSIKLLTRTKEKSHSEYIADIRSEQVALAVKKADTVFNLNESLKISDERRIKKYSAQLSLLALTR